MNITINGTSKTFAPNANLAHLVNQFCKAPKTIITEVNGTIIPPSSWEKTPINEGDQIELVTFVGGG